MSTQIDHVTAVPGPKAAAEKRAASRFMGGQAAGQATRWLSSLALLSALVAGCSDNDPTQPSSQTSISYWDDWEPEWAPDGSRIAVRSNRAAQVQPAGTEPVVYDIGHNDLYLLDTDGNATQLTDSTVGVPPSAVAGLTGVRSLSWSSDGRVVFSSGDSLFIVEQDGSNLRTLLGYEQSPGDIAASPTGGAIAFTWTRGCSNSGCEPLRISVFDPEAGTVSVITDPRELSAHSPSWSPDGSQLAYWARRGGRFSIETMNLDGSNRESVFESGLGDGDLAWSPCGDQFAFTRTFGPGDHRIMLVGTDGSDLRELTSGEQPSWSPDCVKLAFIRPFTSESGIDVWIANTDGSSERRLTRREVVR